jgi:hypothetical protein
VEHPLFKALLLPDVALPFAVRCIQHALN